MINTPSPLEALASFALTFVAGALTVTLIAVYGKFMERRGAKRAV